MPQPSELMLGLQLWLNLPRKDKFAPPQYRDLTAVRIPKVQEDGAVVRVISGRHGGTQGATQGDYVPVLLLDVGLDAGATWRRPVDASLTLFIYIVEGSGLLGDPPTRVTSRQAVLFGEGGDFAVQASEAGMRFMLMAGPPLGKPIAWGGPIVMNTRQELEQAFAEIDAGTFIRR